MPALVAGIQPFVAAPQKQDVDGGDKAGEVAQFGRDALQAIALADLKGLRILQYRLL
jgi:hypothetical protein